MKLLKIKCNMLIFDVFTDILVILPPNYKIFDN